MKTPITPEKKRQYYLNNVEAKRANALKRYYDKCRNDPDYIERRKKYLADWRAKNAEKGAALKKAWYERNKEELHLKAKARWKEKNKDKPKRVLLTPEERIERRRAAGRKFYAANKETLKAKNRELWKEQYQNWKAAREKRFKENPEFLLRHRLRTRMNHALNGRLKAANTMALVGCSSSELRQHIESQWRDGMNWSNYGFGHGKWTVDHIRPLASFQLSDPEQQKQAFNFQNLSPLWFHENALKSSRWNGKTWRGKHHLPPCNPVATA